MFGEQVSTYCWSCSVLHNSRYCINTQPMAPNALFTGLTQYSLSHCNWHSQCWGTNKEITQRFTNTIMMLLVGRKMFMYAAHFYSTSILQPSVCVCMLCVCVSEYGVWVLCGGGGSLSSMWIHSAGPVSGFYSAPIKGLTWLMLIA